MATARPPKGVVIAGTHSGCGKTTASLALMAACTRQGLRVQPFKAGPDFIDPGLHQAVTGRPSHNLDGWMLGRERCLDIFQRHCRDVDICIVEGVMGLFDGASGANEAGSTAELAKWLGLPVLLVLDVRSMARSAAALAHGYAGFDPALRLAGVLLNRVGSERHKELLLEAMEASGGPPVAGCLPRSQGLELPSRHLGLHTAQEGALTPEKIAALSRWLEESVDLAPLLHSLPAVDVESGQAVPPEQSYQRSLQPKRAIRLGVARDKAFCFYYDENLRQLQASGAELVFFSPLEAERLPSDLQGLYFGGGYPELYAARLADNRGMRLAVREFAQQGGVVYAECGGFMYLMQELHSEEGVFPMAGVYAMHCRMEPRLRSLGYRRVTLSRECLLGPAGRVVKGHEFHYSGLVTMDPEAVSVYDLYDRKGRSCSTEGYVRGNTLGSYVHLHFGATPEAAAAFVAACAGLKQGDM